MKIERILFISLFLLMTMSSIVATSMVFLSLKNTLENEINSNLQRDANLLMEQVDMLIFERLHNIHSWTQVIVMQDRKIGEIDSRLSEFLTDMNGSYKGMFSSLVYVDATQHVLASSQPELIGQIFPSNKEKFIVDFPNRELLIEDVQSLSSKDYQNTKILVRIPVHSKYSLKDIGYLYGNLDMQYLHGLIDRASNTESGDRFIIVIDGEGKMITASNNLRTPKYFSKPLFSDWRPKDFVSVFKRSGEPITPLEVVIGYANSEGYLGYAPLAWSVLVVQQTDQAYITISTLWFILFFIIIVTLVFAFLASHIISKRIAKPLVELTQWVKAYISYNPPPEPFTGTSNTTEIIDLGNAFNQMLNALEDSRDHCIEASKLAVVGEMSAIMAHEVRTPLSILSSAAQFLKKEQTFNKEGTVMIQVILDESNRLNKLITNLLACASPREANMQALNLDELLENVALLLKTKIENKQHKFAIKLFPNAKHIIGDKELLTQAFLNLLLNAIQMTPEEGTIQITSNTTKEGQIEVEIADSGPGIHTNDMHRLFDPFFTKREGGIGLGLTITQQIIKSHRGSITVCENKWGGASFKLFFPIT